MATDLTGLIGSVFVDASFKATKTEDLSIPQDALAWRETLSFTFGDAVVKVDQLWHDQRSINPAANDDIDLQTELNGFGLAIALDTARVVIIRPVGGALKVGAPVTFQWQAWFAAAGDIELVGEDGIVVHVAPGNEWQTIDATHKVLRLANQNVVEDDWVADTAYGLTDICKPTVPNGFYYECTDAGTTHVDTEPVWPEVLGETIVDGTATWTCVDNNVVTVDIIVAGITA